MFIVKHKAKLIFSLFLIASVGFTYMIFDRHLEATGEEIVTNFLETKAVDIQQGNLITPLAENQRFIFSSRFVTGIKLYGIKSGQTHIALGDNFRFQVPGELPEKEMASKRVGFLHTHIFYFFRERNLLLIFEVKSVFLATSFFIFVGILSTLSGIFFVSMRKEEEKRLKAIFEMGRRLRHDISSAMSTVVGVAENCKVLPDEDRQSLLSFYERVKSILDDLKFNSKSIHRHQKKIPLHFTALVKDVYNESLVKNKARGEVKWKLDIPSDCLDLCLGKDNYDLARCMHNLIDNAVESIEAEGKVTLSLERTRKEIVFKINDTGTGIAPDNLTKMGIEKFSSKEFGEGLGVYHAKKCIEELKGTLNFESTQDQGTTAILKLPYRQTPKVYKLDQNFLKHKNYIMVDDDASVHDRVSKSDLWKNKMANIKCSFSFPEKYDDGVFFLMDYDLRDKNTDGIKLIKEHKLQGRSVLVTGHYSDPETVELCEQEGIRILPKILL